MSDIDFDRLRMAIDATSKEDHGPWWVDFPATRTRITKEIARHYNALDPSPDPSWTEDAEGYVVAPLVNRGTLLDAD